MSTKIASIDSYLHNVDIYLQSLFSLICFCCLIIFTAQFFIYFLFVWLFAATSLIAQVHTTSEYGRVESNEGFFAI